MHAIYEEWPLQRRFRSLPPIKRGFSLQQTLITLKSSCLFGVVTNNSGKSDKVVDSADIIFFAVLKGVPPIIKSFIKLFY